MTTIKLNLKYLHWGTLTVLAIFLLIAPSAPTLQYQSEITDFFDPKDPTLQAFNRLTTDYPMGNDLHLLLKVSDQDLLSEASLNRLYDYITYLESNNEINGVTSILDTPITNTHKEILTLKQFISMGNELDDQALGQVSENITNSIFLASIKESLFALQIDLKSNTTATDTSEYLQAASQFSFSQVFHTGPTAIKQALHEALLTDLTRLLPLILLAGLLILWFFLRSWWLIGIASISLILTLGITIGLMAVSNIVVNQTSSLAFSIAFIIALANNIHLLTSYQQHFLRHHGRRSHDSLHYAISNNAIALLLTTLTTCIGFLSLNASHSPVFSTFGNIAACGVVIAYICTLTTTYSLLSLKPLKNSATYSLHAYGRLQAITHRFNKLSTSASTTKHVRLTVYGISLMAAIGLIFLNTHNDPVDYFPESFSISQASKLSNEAFGLHHPIYLEIDTHETNGVYSARFLSTLKHFKTWVEAQDSVSHAYSFVNQLTMMQPALREHNPKWSNTPMDTQAINDLANLKSLASDGNDNVIDMVNSKRNAALITLAIGPLENSQLTKLEERIKDWFSTDAPQYTIQLSGHGLLFSNIGASLTSNMLWGGFLSALIISLLMGFFLGNWRISVIALVPNLLPAFVIFGLFGWLFGNVDLAAAGTLSISIGIVVDDSIHLLKHYIDYRKQGYSPDKCTTLTIEKVGPALILTTLVLATGIGIMGFSVFGPNQTTAVFLSSIISVALLYDLILLPGLMRVADTWLFGEVTTFEGIDTKSS